MAEVLSVDQVIARIRGGEHATAVVEVAAGPTGPDRHDIASREEFLAGYNKIVQDIAHYDGRITVDWPSKVADALAGRDPQVRADLLMLAQTKRDEYLARGTNIADAQGSAPLWNDILKGIIATRTEELPPPAQPAS